jgi:glucan-binding YG repeat protein
MKRIEELRQNRRDSYKKREGQSKENNSNYYHHSREQHSKEKGWIKPTTKPQTAN